MIKLTILNPDNTIYWTESFNDKESQEKWLLEEKTRPYWNKDFVCDIEEILPQVEVIDEQSKINQESLAYLAATDWYVTRFVETSIEIPEDVKLKRQEARNSIVR